MRIWQHFLASISVLWICQAAKNDTNLTPFIDKSAQLARLSAAIAIQNAIYDPTKSAISDVTAEFLNVPPSILAELQKHDFKSLADRFQDYSKSLDQISVKVKNGDGLVNALNLLDSMKAHEQFLVPNAIGDQTDHFKKTTDVMITAGGIGKRMLDTSDFKDGSGILKSISSNDTSTVKDKINLLTRLDITLAKTEKHIEEISDYKNTLKDYLSLTSLPDDLDNFIRLATIAGDYSTTFEQIDSYRTDLAAASKDSDKMKAAIQELQKYSTMVLTLSTASILNSTFSNHPAKLWTVGLLDHKDLETVFTDMNNPWIQSVLDDRDVTPLIAGLEPLKSFLAQFQVLVPEWKSVTYNESSRSTTTNLVKSINIVSESGKKVMNSTGATSPFTEVSNCIQSLQPIQKVPDRRKLDEIVAFAENVAQNVKTFTEAMDGILKHDTQKTIANTQVVKDLIRSINERTSENDTLTAWEEVQSSSATNQLIEAFESIAGTLINLPRSLFYEGKADYNVIKDISTVFEGTNVVSVMQCIQKSSVSNLVEMFKFIRQTDDMKGRKSEFKTAGAYITSISKIQGHFKKILDEAKYAKFSDEALKIKESKSFQIVQKISEGIGRGVYSLRVLDNFAREKNSVVSVTSSQTFVNKAIPQLKVLYGQYDDGFRNNLSVTFKKVEDFVTSAKNKPSKSLADIKKVYVEAGKLESKYKTDRQFLKKIGKDLSNHNEARFKKMGAEFKAIGDMDLDFVKHSASLITASTIFDHFKETIVEFLEFAEKVAQEKKSESSGMSMVIIIIIVLVVILVVGLLFWSMRFYGWGVYKYINVEITEEEFLDMTKKKTKGLKEVVKDKKWTKRERVWSWKKDNNSKSKPSKKSKTSKKSQNSKASETSKTATTSKMESGTSQSKTPTNAETPKAAEPV